MALHVPKAPGFAQMLKDGARVSFYNENFVIYRHVFFCKWLSNILAIRSTTLVWKKLL